MAALLLVVPATAAACGEEGTEDTGPLIKEAKVSPSILPAEGGTGAISVRVEDDCGVQQVYATIYGPEGIYMSFEMLPVEDINTNARAYRSESQIPANFQESAVSYGVIISAEDTNGAFAETYAGDIEVAGVQFDEPPYVTDPSISPTALPATGGPVKIAISASDNRGLGNVFAIVNFPGGIEKEVTLEPISSSRFVGTFVAPANKGAYVQHYSVAMFAEDDIGQTTGAYGGVFTVAGVPALSGHFALTPPYPPFARVTVGHTIQRRYVLTNTGPAGSPPLKGVATIAGSPYFTFGSHLEEVHFSLAPGATRTFTIAFQAAVLGPQQAFLSIKREDGAQSNLGAQLVGEGIKRVLAR
ncbi:MAG TPA: hypothetical protein VIH47_05745 [Solirubrobacterales bacterium]